MAKHKNESAFIFNYVGFFHILSRHSISYGMLLKLLANHVSKIAQFETWYKTVKKSLVLLWLNLVHTQVHKLLNVFVVYVKEDVDACMPYYFTHIVSLRKHWYR